MKYAGQPLPVDDAALEAMRAATGTRKLVLFASTHDGEEAIAARAIRTLATRHPDILGIVMPRHPARGEAAANAVEKEGLAFARRSLNQKITDKTRIYIADTLGEPGLFYRLCRIVYLGNSLIGSPGGGHNPVEPAQLGCAVVYGPNMWNFSEIDADLRAANAAIIVRDENNLQATLDKLLSDPELAERMGAAARDFVNAQNGMLVQVLELLRPILGRAKIAA